MSFIDELKWRGLVQDISNEEAVAALPAGTPFYAGFDPTARSLQLGNLVPLIVSMHLAKAGLKPLILFGGATGAIGDPSGKSVERQLLPREVLEANVENQKRKTVEILERFGCQAEFVDNLDWTRDLSVLDFLRDVGKHFTVNYMIAKEVVKTRLSGEGISFTEFSYMLLQAFDFYHLFQSKGCRLQIGGSDQWGNITAGLELIRRRAQGDAVAFSIPLIVDAQGKKFGKSESGAIWLDRTQTSPYKFHQFWPNIEDADVVRYLKIFTFVSRDEIVALEESVRARPERREAQNFLADSVCTLVHGAEATRDARRSAEVLFGGSLSGLSESQLEEIFSDVPSSTISIDRAGAITIIDALVETRLTSSKGEARKLVQNGGAYINNERVTDGASKLPLDGNLVVLRSGKKNYHLVRLTA